MEKYKKPLIIGGIILGVLLVLGLVIFAVKSHIDAKNALEQMNKSVVEMKQLQDQIARSQANYTTEEGLEQRLKDLHFDLDKIQDDLDRLNANMIAVNSVLVSTPGYKGSNLPSSSTTPNQNPLPPTLPCENGVCKNPDVHGYLSAIQVFKLNEPFAAALNVPYGRMMFDATQAKPWTYEVSPRDYKITTVISQDEDGRHFTHNQFTIGVEGKDYLIPIKNASIVEKYPEAEFRFSPRLYLGIGAGVGIDLATQEADDPIAEFEAVPSLEFSFFSYGKTKVNPDFTVLNVGLGVHLNDPKPALLVSPFNYNIGQDLPLVDNLFVGPSVSIDTNGELGIIGGIKVGL